MAIAQNSRIFFFNFEMGFDRYIREAKEFFLNIDPVFFTLIDLDAQSLIKEV